MADRKPGLMEELRRAMDELKHAEMQQLAREHRSSLFDDVAVTEPAPVEGQEERTDYDDESARIAEERHHFVEAVPDEERAERVADVVASPAEPAPGRASPLSRFMKDGARGAIVVAEILARPRSERGFDE